MAGYVFTLTVPNLNLANEDLLDLLFEQPFEAYPAVVNGVPEIRIHSDEQLPTRAVGMALDALHALGLRPSAVATDFVSTSEIAERADVSRETARLWSTGARRSGFPLSIGTVGTSSIWDWADVHQWLVANALPIDEMFADQPLPKDTREVMNGRIALARMKRASGWTTVSKPVVLVDKIEMSGARLGVGLLPYRARKPAYPIRERTA